MSLTAHLIFIFMHILQTDKVDHRGGDKEVSFQTWQRSPKVYRWEEIATRDGVVTKKSYVYPWPARKSDPSSLVGTLLGEFKIWTSNIRT